jgi:hypothetical protein
VAPLRTGRARGHGARGEFRPPQELGDTRAVSTTAAEHHRNSSGASARRAERERAAERHAERGAEREAEATAAQRSGYQHFGLRPDAGKAVSQAMMRSSLVATIVAFALASVPAFAQTKRKSVRDELPPAAQALWDDAVRATQYSPPEWDKAAAKFQEAYEASRNPRVLFNVGVAERFLQHYARAAQKFRQELAEGGGKLTAQEKAEIQQTLAILDRSISTIELTVSEADATVFLDNLKVGSTPIAPIPADVSRTPHQLRIEKEGFIPFEKPDVLVGSGTPLKLNVELEPRVKKAQVEIAISGAPGASIWIDGIDRGPAPFKGLVEVGARTFEARQPGYEPTAQRHEVVYKQNMRVQLALERAITTGLLRIETLDGAQIEVDGKSVGTTTWEGNVDIGSHTVNARKDGYNPGTIELHVAKGETVSRRLPLIAVKSNDWVFWTVGSVIVVAGAVVVAGFVFAPKDQSPVIGTFDPGLVGTGSHRIRF